MEKKGSHLVDSLRKFAATRRPKPACAVCVLGSDVVEAINEAAGEVPGPAILEWLKQEKKIDISIWRLRNHFYKRHHVKH